MPDTPAAIDRRTMFRWSGGAAAAGAGLLLSDRLAAQGPAYPPPTVVDTGQVEGGRVTFPDWRAPVDPAGGPAPAPLPPERRVGFAVVALGRLSLQELLPAFAQCKRAKLTALVSGTPDKLALTARQYGIAPEHTYSYDQFDRIAADPAIQAVYVVLPNGMHREYTIRAAQAGKHVLCEKPMATSVAEAEAMIAACAKARVKLMVAYRIQYQPHNRALRRFVQDGTFGRLVTASCTNVQTVAQNGALQWRHDAELAGGGSLPDIGLYCINTMRFVTGREPVEVFGQIYSPPGDPRYAEVEETVNFMMRFADGFTANCVTSYGARDDKHQRVNFFGATADMANAYKYRGQALSVHHNTGGDVGPDRMGEEADLQIAANNQFAAEIDHLADCILTGRDPWTPGEEGLQDHRIMEAIYDSARRNRPVALPRHDGLDVFRNGPLPLV